jgi:iron complex transport system permease protein
MGHHRVRAGVWTLGLAALLVLTALTSATVGPVDIGVPTVTRVVLDALPFLTLETGASSAARTIVLEIRLPRILLGAVVGFALATAGAVMQGFFRNPMADPSIIGVSSGGAVGAVAVIVAPVALPFGLGLSTAALLGALVAAFGVYLIATQNGHTPVPTLLLAGVAVQTFLGAVVSFLLVQSGDHALREAMFWLMGNLYDTTWGDLRLVLPPALLAFAVLYGYARDLNVLLLGEADARSLGVEVERTKRVLLAVASLVTGAAVAVSGVIGFVGLIVPHAMRLLVGPDHRVLLPASALAGATFLVLADTVARSGAAELPVGIVTAFVGVPFFLYLLRQREVRSF